MKRAVATAPCNPPSPTDAPATACEQALWRQLQDSGLSRAALLDLYVRHKYLVMSRDLEAYRRLGHLLAAPRAQPLPELAQQVVALIARAMARAPSRGGDANALLHIRGYLKQRLSAAEQRELDEAIARYRSGAAEFEAPLALLRGHFRRHPHPYIARQVFMQPRGDA